MIHVNPKYQKPFKLKSKALWILSTNHIPISSDNTEGLYRRFKFIRFSSLKEEERQENFFSNKLKKEMPGIIRMILTEGKALWERDKGFLDTEEHLKLQREMEERHSVSGYWMGILDEYLESKKRNRNLEHSRRPFDTVPSGSYEGSRFIDYYKHYPQYVEYCETGNQRPFSLPTFKSDSIHFF